MPETFTPFTWADDQSGGTPITAGQLNRIETGVNSIDVRAAALEYTAPEFFFNVKAYGAVGDGTTDDTAAINAAMNAARMSPFFKRAGIVYFPPGQYLISAPINLYDGVHIVGNSGYKDPVYYNSSALVAAVGFTGSAMMLQNPDGNTVFDPTERPDESWHFGLLDNMCFIGNGISGPHGLDPGWNGEATTIRNCGFKNCNSAIYLNNVQASATIEHCSMFDNRYGVNCDDISSTVRIFGISGDNNVSLLRVKGGLSTNVTVMSLKAESYTAGSGDPVIDIVDLDGGSVTVVGGWCDTDAARSRVVKLSATTATNRPRVTLLGFGANTNFYTNMVDDTIASTVAPIILNGLSRNNYFWNEYNYTGGQAQTTVIGYRSGSTALASLITALAKSGIIVDGTSNAEQLPLNTQTGTSYTLVIGDGQKVVEMNNAAANTLTVPPNSSVAFATGVWIIVRQLGAGQTTIAAGAGVTIRSNGSAFKLIGQYAEATLMKRATDEWVLNGKTTV